MLYRTRELRPTEFPAADLVVLTSASSARALAAVTSAPAVVTIGPETSRAARERRAADRGRGSPHSSGRHRRSRRRLSGAIRAMSRCLEPAADLVHSTEPVFITFLTDFGLQDDFVGTCHGVIKRIAPEAQIIDITHGIPAQAVLQGALVLANTLPYMPVGVHLAVVDPGVGSHRRPLALQDGEGRLLRRPGQRPARARRRAGRDHRRARARESELRPRDGLADVPRARSLRPGRGASLARRLDRRARPADRPGGARAARAAGAPSYRGRRRPRNHALRRQLREHRAQPDARRPRPRRRCARYSPRARALGRARTTRWPPGRSPMPARAT